MKILQLGGSHRITVLLFGVGLIGGAVDRALRLRNQPETRLFPYDWHDAGLRQAQTIEILSALRPADRIVVVWAGGQGGFASTAAEMSQETALVAEVIAMAESLGKEGRAVDFHLLSSGGGLFESQTHCDGNSPPYPLRPYGMGKMHQEDILLRAAGLNLRRIYRPSSVYGVTHSRRVGLITALLSNMMRGGTTRIFGNPNTLRDYVLVNDVGQYMARKIMQSGTGGAVDAFLLASGRPASVFEVIEEVRRCMDKPLLLQFDPHPSNVRDMSFLPSALPSDWRATPLNSGISRIATFFRSGSV